MKENEKVIDAEVVDDKEKSKKGKRSSEGGFGSFWNKAKNSIGTGILEERLKNAYRQQHTEFDYYSYGENSFFNSSSVYGELDGDTLTYFGSVVLPLHTIVVNTKTNKAYSVEEKATSTEVSVNLNDEIYTRPGMKLNLDPNVTEVKVVKADDRYFLYKGE